MRMTDVSGLSEEKVERIFARLTGLPSLPAAVEKLVRLSQTEASPRQFAEIISTDQGLAAKVLRLVNSAFYGLSKPISSLHHASSLLGTKTLKSLVLSVSVMQLFSKGCAGFRPLEFWKHSLATAIAGRRLAQSVRPDLEDDVYVAGLLHDTGVALFAQHLSEEYAIVLRLIEGAGASRRPLRDVEQQVFGTHHAEIGYTQVTRWRLAESVCECIRYHETDAEGVASRVEDPGTREALDLLRLADHWVTRAGFGYLEPLPSEEADLAGELAPWTGRTDAQVGEIVGDLRGELQRVEVLICESERVSVEPPG